MPRPRNHPQLPKGVSFDPDRHGNPRLYFRAAGRLKIRLRETPGTEAFDAELLQARQGQDGRPAGKEATSRPARDGYPADGTLDWLVMEYKRRAAGTVTLRTWSNRARILEEVCDSLSPKRRVRHGTLPYAVMEKRHIVAIRDELRPSPGGRNDVTKALSAMFSWAVGTAGLLKVNPCAGIKRLRSGDGFHTWTEDEVRRFEAVHPPGSQAHLALTIGLYTGFRLQTLAIFGPGHVTTDGWIKIRPAKTARSSGIDVEVPILPELEAALRERRVHSLTYLVTQHGKPFTVKGLGNKMRDWCDEAGLFHCTMHGLRKTGATRAAQNGATEKQLMAIFGWTTMQQAAYYTEKADRKRLAGTGIKFLKREPWELNGP